MSRIHLLQEEETFFSDMVTEIGKLDSAKENIKGIREFLGTGKRITFSKQGVREQIGTILTERLLLGLPSGHVYSYNRSNFSC